LFPMFRRRSFSEADGGGGITAVTGTAPDTTIVDGPITAGIRRGIKDCPLTGGIVTATVYGALVPGIRITFNTARRVIRPVGVSLPDAPRVIRAAAGLPAGIPPVVPVAGIPVVPAAGRAVDLPPVVFIPVPDIPPGHRESWREN